MGSQNDKHALNKRRVIIYDQQLDHKDQMERFNPATSQIHVGHSKHWATKRYLVSSAIIITTFTCSKLSCNNVALRVEFSNVALFSSTQWKVK